MVRATNSGGEAQSIADFAVFEPTPDTMVEVHKTLVCENIKDKKVEEVSNIHENSKFKFRIQIIKFIQIKFVIKT